MKRYALCLLLLVGCNPTAPLPKPSGITGTVARVMDGDTVKFTATDGTIRVSLLISYRYVP